MRFVHSDEWTPSGLKRSHGSLGREMESLSREWHPSFLIRNLRWDENNTGYRTFRFCGALPTWLGHCSDRASACSHSISNSQGTEDDHLLDPLNMGTPKMEPKRFRSGCKWACVKAPHPFSTTVLTVSFLLPSYCFTWFSPIWNIPLVLREAI